MRDLLSGKPAIVMDGNGIDFTQLKKLNISSEELMEALRNLDYFDMTEIGYAIIERTGKITVIPKSASMPATRKDLKIVKPENDVCYCIIENGKIIKKNLKEMGIPYDVCVRDILPKIWGSMRGEQPDDERAKIKRIAFCSLSADGNVFIQAGGDAAQDFKIKILPSYFTEEKLADNAQKENKL
jgi:hypothetical protein